MGILESYGDGRAADVRLHSRKSGDALMPAALGAGPTKFTVAVWFNVTPVRGVGRRESHCLNSRIGHGERECAINRSLVTPLPPGVITAWLPGTRGLALPSSPARVLLFPVTSNHHYY